MIVLLPKTYNSHGRMDRSLRTPLVEAHHSYLNRKSGHRGEEVRITLRHFIKKYLLIGVNKCTTI